MLSFGGDSESLSHGGGDGASHSSSRESISKGGHIKWYGGKGKHQRREKVDLEELLDFVFTKSQQHPQSTGRLIAFGLFGPLDENGQLRSGQRGQHILQGWELDSLCQSFEKEDILQSYIPFGGSVSTLTQAQMQEILGQTDSSLKKAKGKASMPQVTETEVVELLDVLPRDNQLMYSFHDIQRAVMQWRVDRIAKSKVAFSTVVATTTSKRDKAVQRQYAREHTDISATGGHKLAFAAHKSFRVSASVAPATMFLRNHGLRDVHISQAVTKLLSTSAFKIANLQDANSPALLQNVRLMRSEDNNSGQRGGGGAGWDGVSGLRGTGRGSMVRCARSTTTSTTR